MDFIRVSASYLFNIQLNDKFLLVKSERRNQYQPVGGCYKYFPEAEEFLFAIEAIPEKKSNGVDSLMDLRLLIPDSSLDLFVDWFKSGIDRETTYDREFFEEIVSLLPQEKQGLFNNLQTDKQANGSFDVFFDEEKGLNSIKPMDIISVKLNPEQLQTLKNACSSEQSSLILASEEDILKGYKVLKDNTRVKIGGHTKNILQPQIATLQP